MKMRSRRRWSDHDVDLGPLTFAWQPKCATVGLMLCSGDDEHLGAALRLHLWALTILLALPHWLVPPQRTKVYPHPSVWGPDVIARLGRDWYYDVSRREFGFTLHGSGTIGESVHLSIHYGRQTMDSSTEKSWGCFLPWTCWRHVRHSLYDLTGSHFADMPDSIAYSWEDRRRLEASCPTVVFTFTDFDGETLTATTRIEEREWLRGEGWFKWLSRFSKPIIRRSLDISFSGETGRRKGSWKGGTIGTGIEMHRLELHLSAFRRYCIENEMKLTEPA